MLVTGEPTYHVIATRGERLNVSDHRPRRTDGESTAAYLGLGSNVGERRAHLAGAISDLHGAGRITGVSGVYETEPQGYLDQPSFLNLVVRLDTSLGPVALLERLLEIERSRGRVRTVPNGPRTLDIDILLYGDRVIEQEGLTIPHPRMTERTFVLVPLLELSPAAVDPRTGRPYAESLARLIAGRPKESGLRYLMTGEDLLDAENG